MALSRLDYSLGDYEDICVYKTKKGQRVIMNIGNLHLHFTIYKFKEFVEKINECDKEVEDDWEFNEQE